MSRKIEAKLQDKFLKLLTSSGVSKLKTTGGKYYNVRGPVKSLGKGLFSGIFGLYKSEKGYSDIIVFDQDIPVEDCESCWNHYKGQIPATYFIEVKTDIGKLEKTQIDKFEELSAMGFGCYILRPKHWEKAKAKGKLSFGSVFVEMERYVSKYERN